MKSITHWLCILLTTVCAQAMLACPAYGEAKVSPSVSDKLPQRPVITKKGTVDLDLCETTPFVFHGKLYRLEWFRHGGYLRIMDHDAQTEVSHFGAHHRFPCAYVEGDTVYVIGTREDRGWFGNTLTVFTSTDLLQWKEQVAFADKDYGICNTSVCKADGRYLMSIEVNALSKVTNGTFACRFLESKDLVHWTLTPPECRHGFDGGLCSPHLIRYLDGWQYLFSTIHTDKGYVLILNRSRDLIKWESSPFNPIMWGEDADKVIYNQKLTPEQRENVAKAKNIDNSDIDFCDFNGKLMISYCWGNQVGKEFIAEAEYAGSTSEFLRAWFPDMGEWAGIDVTQPLSTFAADRKKYGAVLSAAGATVTTSSADAQQQSPQELLSGSCTRGFAIHTKPETNPWVQIDLGRECAITGVLVRNRTDCCQARAEKLRLQGSSDGTTWHGIWEASSVEQGWEIPLLEQNITARYLRFDTRPATAMPLHLQHVEVWGTPTGGKE